MFIQALEYQGMNFSMMNGAMSNAIPVPIPQVSYRDFDELKMKIKSIEDAFDEKGGLDSFIKAFRNDRDSVIQKEAAALREKLNDYMRTTFEEEKKQIEENMKLALAKTEGLFLKELAKL
jgi:hypothetical protein